MALQLLAVRQLEGQLPLPGDAVVHEFPVALDVDEQFLRRPRAARLCVERPQVRELLLGGVVLLEEDGLLDGLLAMQEGAEADAEGRGRVLAVVRAVSPV